MPAPQSLDAGLIGASILSSLDLPVIVIDRSRAVVSFNPTAAMFCSLTPSHVSRPLRDVQFFADVKGLEELCEHAIAGGSSSQREVRDGTGSWFILRIVPYAGSDRKIAGAVLTLTNVTAFRASLEQAVYEREYTKAILNTVTEPLVVLDQELRVQTANQAFYAMFQVSREQTRGLRLYDLGTPDWDIPRLQQLLREAHADRQSEVLETEHEFPAIGRRTVLLTARRLSGGGALGQTILLSIEDITERKHAALIPARLAAIVESSDDAIISKDVHGVIMSWNAGAERIFGYAEAEACGRSILFLIPPDRVDEERMILERIQRGERIEHYETVRRRKDGRLLQVSLTVSPIKDPAGRIIGASKIARDITERRRTEEQLRNSLKEKEVLLKEIHHRVKNNLQIVSGLLNLQADTIQDPNIRELFEESRNRIKAMGLIHETLYSSPNLAMIDMAAYIRSLTDQLRGLYGEGITIDIRVHKILFDVDTAIPCGLILNELISNAIKHAFPTGTGRILVELTEADAGVVLAVQDDGIGMPPGIDPATTESLGLRLVDTLVHQLDGHLQIGRGQGTRAAIRFVPPQRG